MFFRKQFNDSIFQLKQQHCSQRAAYTGSKPCGPIAGRYEYQQTVKERASVRGQIKWFDSNSTAKWPQNGLFKTVKDEANHERSDDLNDLYFPELSSRNRHKCPKKR